MVVRASDPASSSALEPRRWSTCLLPTPAWCSVHCRDSAASRVCVSIAVRIGLITVIISDRSPAMDSPPGNYSRAAPPHAAAPHAVDAVFPHLHQHPLSVKKLLTLSYTEVFVLLRTNMGSCRTNVSAGGPNKSVRVRFVNQWSPTAGMASGSIQRNQKTPACVVKDEMRGSGWNKLCNSPCASLMQDWRRKSISFVHLIHVSFGAQSTRLCCSKPAFCVSAEPDRCF